ncbi:recombination mediator RecR [Candidatus Aquarickettsia rohweri]|uniref:Recombination protein RecR n=1 Tax=Candidatus Aquarickettsia rohweri TaxID=2602574 RepID=A0A3R9ZA87_9RICK|nr:recombination mediator RecR [Candidatus Aquarickettsia rohweri]MSO13998.1 Recombination protein RecR [Rickettsiales endosymbiont of Trichoplax sp. H2]RST68929.1 recombination protein RecR [Candidatus Aquarickettsia rohweri]
MKITSLEQLIKTFSKFPGLGPKSAKRIALYLIQNKSNLSKLSQLFEMVYDEIKICSMCFNIDISNPCQICINEKRDKTTLCIVENIADLWAIEKSKTYQGIYHVLGGALSAIDGNTPDKLNLHNLLSRVKDSPIKEVIIATNSTLEGQTTAHYIAQLLEKLELKISRLANGIPIGTELDYIDQGTLSLALKLRQKF